MDELYRKHGAELTAALAISSRDWQTAEDLCHEVFIVALDRQDQLRQHANPRGWLFQTGYNMARNRLRLLFRRRHKVAQEHPVMTDIAWHRALELSDSLNYLSARQRDAVVLHYYFGFSVSETSHVLGCSQTAVKTHLQRARATLGNLLSPEAE